MVKTPLIIVSAPSGSGKSSLCNKALEDFPGRLAFSISYTTRPPRSGETDGNPYFFVTNKRFQEMIQKKLFAEWAIVHSYHYGTSKEQLQKIWNAGKFVMMDIDIQGAEILKKQYPKAHTIFILPPTLQELEKRLRIRDGLAEHLEIRLKNAKKEMAMADQYDHQITNDEFEPSYEKFKSIILDILKTKE